MDRNFYAVQVKIVKMVALRKESVDRNAAAHRAFHAQDRSLSARRAWIEIAVCLCGAVIPKGRSPQGERG